MQDLQREKKIKKVKKKKDLERKQANSLRDSKGEAKQIILPFQWFKGLKIYLYLSNAFRVIFWLKNINKAAPRPSQNFAFTAFQIV